MNNQNQQIQKIKSVLDLSKFKIGDKPYWLIMRPIGPKSTIFDDDDAWAFDNDVHPKARYERDIVKGVWPKKRSLPKLHATDFCFFIEFLTSELVIEVFDIVGVERCAHTGEFIYENESSEWMPESYLFSKLSSVKNERVRIKKMIGKWAQSNRCDLI